jgi:hypothetical protein
MGERRSDRDWLDACPPCREPLSPVQEALLVLMRRSEYPPVRLVDDLLAHREL